jgi:uncharacterized protein YndB with AHSA1/START domain
MPAQIRIEDERLVGADRAIVWEAIKDTTAHARWHPFLTAIEGAHDLGATRACTVSIGGKVAHTSEQCVVDNALEEIRWRIDEDSSGFRRMASDWTAGFTLRETDSGTIVTAQSSFKPRNAAARLLLPIVRRRFHGAQRAILNGLKQYVEGRR